MNNSLAEVHPELITEWSEKNLPLTPDDITFGSNKKVWWNRSYDILTRTKHFISSDCLISKGDIRLSYYTDSESSYKTSDKRFASLCSAAFGFLE